MVNTDTHSGPSFSLQNRIFRLLWGVVRVLFYLPSPKPLQGWRRCLLRLFGAKIHPTANPYPQAKVWAPWNLTMEAHSCIANGSIIYSQGPIRLGEYVVISQGAHLCAGTHDFNQPGFPLIAKPIEVKAHAWVAAEAFVHPGVTIGEGCVVGARSVVTKDLPDWMVCSGFPAKPLKERPRIHIAGTSSDVQ